MILISNPFSSSLLGDEAPLQPKMRLSPQLQLGHDFFLSKRFALKRFLGLSEDEIKENERMWREENGANLKAPADAQSQLRGIGVTPGGMAADTGAQEAEAPLDMAAAAEPGADAGAEVAPEAPVQ